MSKAGHRLFSLGSKGAYPIWKQSPFLDCVLSKPALDTRGSDSAQEDKTTDSPTEQEIYMHKESYIYLLANKHNNVLYTGVSNDLIRRVYEHKNKLVAGFTKKYNVDRLVYYEACGSIIVAIEREKQIKGWSRKKKHDLINALTQSGMICINRFFKNCST